MPNKNYGSRRPTTEDRLRAFGYANLLLWSVLFFFFPPVAFTSNVGVTLTVLFLWMGTTFIGSIIALIGSLTGVDLKVELPGAVIAFVGPLLYFVSQVYFMIVPPPADHGLLPRIAIAAFAILPCVLISPRIYALWAESRKQRRLNLSALKNIKLTDAENAQPGAGLHFKSGD